LEGQGDCQSAESTECLADEAPTSAPTPAPTLPSGSIEPGDCFRDWSSLRQAVVNANFTEGRDTEFLLCPRAVLNVIDGPIVIERGDILIQCGSSGRLEDDCTVLGGEVQFHITGQPNSFTLLGITMMNSTAVSVQATGIGRARATFERCLWKHNMGGAAVLVYNDGVTIDSQTNIGALDPPSAPSMRIEFDTCEFLDNEVSFATVANIGGTSIFLQSIFTRNGLSSAGVISASYSAFVALTECCFADNDSQFPGTVFLSNQAELSLNQDNYGTFNRAGSTDACKGIFTETSGSCVENAICEGTCSVFEAESCAVPDAEFQVPTATPSMAPSAVETPPVEPGANNETEVTFKEVTLFSSQFWLRNLLTAILVVIVCICAAGYKMVDDQPPATSAALPNEQQQKQQQLQESSSSQKGNAMDINDPENNKSGILGGLRGLSRKTKKEEHRIAEPYFADDDVILDPATSSKRKIAKKKKLFGLGKKKKKQQQENQQSVLMSDDDIDDDGDLRASSDMT